ncbi:MAG TPA: hypothetical protein VKT81_22705 [Bryobacteraceae bacterium]|nr:hypothetical protein [Bryobacteraceae bacterium]
MRSTIGTAHNTYKADHSIGGRLFVDCKAIRSYTVVLLSIIFWRLFELTLEGAYETGMMFITHRVSNFFDRQVAGGKQVSGFTQPLFSDQIAQIPASLLLEQTLQVRRAEMNFNGELTHRASGLRFDSIQHLTQAALSKEGLKATALGGRPDDLRLIQGQSV